MRRRSWVWAILLFVAVVAAVGGVFVALLKQEPAFYTRAEVAAPRPDDPRRASDLQTRVSELQAEVFTEEKWGMQFTQDDVNAFFRQDPANNNLVEPLLGLTAPRVEFSGDRIRFAARSGSGFWSTVVSVELRAWLIADEPNLFAVEVVSLKAGAVPLPERLVMDRVTAFGADNKATVTWFRSNGRPVAVVRWLSNLSRPTTLLQTVSVADGSVSVGGRNQLAR